MRRYCNFKIKVYVALETEANDVSTQDDAEILLEVNNMGVGLDTSQILQE
jgi:hypothetical protein